MVGVGRDVNALPVHDVGDDRRRARAGTGTTVQRVPGDDTHRLIAIDDHHSGLLVAFHVRQGVGNTGGRRKHEFTVAHSPAAT